MYCLSKMNFLQTSLWHVTLFMLLKKLFFYPYSFQALNYGKKELINILIFTERR